MSVFLKAFEWRIMVDPEENIPEYVITFGECFNPKSEWCKRKKIEGTILDNEYYGWAACYNPKTKTICFGSEIINKEKRKSKDQDEFLTFIIDVLCHEEDHRIIHKMTQSDETSKNFDALFFPPFDWINNGRYFRFGRHDLSNE